YILLNMRSLTLLATLALVCLFGNTSAAVIDPKVIGNTASALDGADTKVNVDHNKIANGNTL
ncbi:hypothetical protein RO3G_13212, partial [Rhizopus delemar RA 99-880]